MSCIYRSHVCVVVVVVVVFLQLLRCVIPGVQDLDSLIPLSTKPVYPTSSQGPGCWGVKCSRTGSGHIVDLPRSLDSLVAQHWTSVQPTLVSVLESVMFRTELG